MNINQLANIAGVDISGLKASGKNDKTDEGFSAFFDKAIETLQSTSDQIKEADQMALDFALGNIDNIHDVMIAQEKASAALQYTIQLRDGFLDAYNEIMRMQV